jgi:hypothetical protein
VIGHEVEQQAHVVRVEHLAERREIAERSQFGIELVVIADVVAVRAAGAGGEHRRGVTVGDAECVEVRGDRVEMPERKVTMELDAVGVDRRTKGRVCVRRCGLGGAGSGLSLERSHQP